MNDLFDAAESWREAGDTPTLQDCVKYKKMDQILLVTSKYWPNPQEIRIRRVNRKGFLKIGPAIKTRQGLVWMALDELRIIDLLPDPPKDKTQEPQTMLEAMIAHALKKPIPPPPPFPPTPDKEKDDNQDNEKGE